MENVKKILRNYSLMTAIIFALLTVWQLVGTIQQIILAIRYSFFWSYVWVLIDLITLAGFGFTAFTAYMKKRDMMGCLGLAAVAAAQVLTFILGLFNMSIYGYRPNFLLSLIMSIPNLIDLAAIAAAVVVAAVVFTPYLSQCKDIAKQYYYAPAAVYVVVYFLSLILYVILLIFGAGYVMQVPSFGNLVFRILFGLGMLFMAAWAHFPEGIPEKAAAPTAKANTSSNGGAPVSTGNGEFSLVAHILLLLFTGGIWLCIWIYRVTAHLNSVPGEQPRNPATKLLLCLFIPFYQIYWTYKSAQLIDKLAASKGKQSDIATICLIFSIFVPIVAPILMQSKLNELAAVPSFTYNPTAAPAAPAAPVTSAAPVSPAHEAPKTSASVADDLKTYKELLDSGIITQEEFDAKKKQILGL